MEDDLTFPRDLEFRLQKILSEDMDGRLKDLSVLVSLQETELAMIWFVLLSLTTYIIIKEHKNGR